MKGPRNRRSLGFARDDRKERVAAKRGQLPKEKAVASASLVPNDHPVMSQAPSPLSNRSLFAATLSFLSSRAKPRDLRFRGPFMEMFFGSHTDKSPAYPDGELFSTPN
jgi:hypothetical protein